MATVNPSVIYEPQTLTQEQKDQVLANIGAMKSFDGEPFTLAEKNKLSGIESGAEANVIEAIKVNGTTQTVTNKTVDISVPEVDQTYNASSTNPQSGTAVAQAIAASGNVPTPQTTDDGKVLKAYEDTSTSTPTMAYKWDVADSGIPSKTSDDDGKVLGVTNQGQSLSWISQPTVNNSTVSVKIGSATETAVGTMTTNQSAASDIVIPMASATNDGSDNWTYVKGAMSGEDKRALDESVTKLGGIEDGAQVNIKPDWEAVAGADAEILNKPTIPTVHDSTISVKFEGDSNAFDSFTTNASSNDTVEIPLATAPSTGVSGNSGAITAADKAKLNALTTSHLHMLKFVSASSEDPAPYGSWVVDLDKPNAQSPYGYDFAMYADIKAGLEAGHIYGLSTYSTAPSGTEDVMVMSSAQLQGSVEHPGVRLDFYSMYASYPYTLHTTSIYTPSMYNGGSGTQYPEGRMGLLSHNGGGILQDFDLTTHGVPDADSGDAGKFLGVNSNGTYSWHMVEHVPGVTSSDDGKVLTASYSGGVGTATWAAPSPGRKVHRIYYDADSAPTGADYGYLQDLEGTFDSTSLTYPQVTADDLYDWIVDGQSIVLILHHNPTAPEHFVNGGYMYPEAVQTSIVNDEKKVIIYFTTLDVEELSAIGAYVDTEVGQSTNYARITLGDNENPVYDIKLQEDLTKGLTSNDAGKVLRAGWDSTGSTPHGTVSWDTASEVPTVGSSDDGKVLKATYSGGAGSYSWETAPSSGEMNVINTVKVNNTALTPDANKAVNVEVPNIKLEGAASTLVPSSNVVTIPNAIATGETGATNGLMTAADKKTVSESVIYKANPSTGADALLAQRLYVVRSDQEIVNIIQGGGAGGQGTILFRIG